ncbi:MAG: hypothetical protein A2784_00095 [Candidatus Chisholmbacteria bacterium RIFCSPHIGHO2_01_FULL_48_12]|uniref:Uncharacterized protein n=1 Tax=Candidatus Chisholmbacteria bacterium RIFCSPHIGHO2_01_FULL_48_12 TaxID=1797589 RepID=A0A1G1VUQ1_9BACT|nr:MAG: hypothetical protein A2784_00095 [Candidatus Chisholmbacteria bacterium RIFCSPHIGHO2_01_FULL_48_12]
MLSKKSLFSLSLILLVSLLSLDLWHPRLDRNRSLTKIFDLLYFPWFSYLSNSLPRYKLTPDNFTFNQKSYPITAKLDQGQWQINFTDQDFQGYRQLILISPEINNFFSDYLALNLAENLGLVTRDRWFAVVKINNQAGRIYQVLEAWNKDVLEKNRRSSDSDLFIPKDYHRLWQSVGFWKKLAINPLAPQDYSALHQLLTATPDQLTRLVSLDSLARWQAYLKLTNRSMSEPFLLYFNRDLGQFEFIPDPQSNVITDTRFLSNLVNLPSVKIQVDQLAQTRYSQLGYYRQLWQQTRFAFAADLLKPYSTLFFTVSVWQQRPKI